MKRLIKERIIKRFCQGYNFLYFLRESDGVGNVIREAHNRIKQLTLGEISLDEYLKNLTTKELLDAYDSQIRSIQSEEDSQDRVG